MSLITRRMDISFFEIQQRGKGYQKLDRVCTLQASEGHTFVIGKLPECRAAQSATGGFFGGVTGISKRSRTIGSPGEGEVKNTGTFGVVMQSLPSRAARATPI